MPAAALREILQAAGFDSAARAHIAGDDPVLPIRYRVATAGSAALAALGLAAARLSGKAQRVSVDARAAAASLRSARYLRVNGKPATQWDPLSGFYPVSDGWISIHCNFANHREAAMRTLGVAHERGTAEAASRKWRGEALEEAIHAAGGCAGYVRSEADWLAHPQARAVAMQPLLSIERIGDAPPEFSRNPRPLGGVRVLDLTRVLAGPTCAKSLAEHGAEVLKISAAHLPDSGLVDLDTGIGKRSARLDVRTEAEKLKALVRHADVFVQSYRPAALAGHGFAPEQVAAMRPGIVHASLSAWGGGPWEMRRGFDSIVQAVSGIAHASGNSSQPRLLPVSAIDYVSGYLMAFGVCVALSRRATEGGSWLVRVALARVGKWIVDRGVASGYEGLPEELPEAELAGLMAEMDAPDGRIRYLKPVLSLSETPPCFEQPPVPLGYHQPAWTST
jgi:crotonobetainyl-CoA:carnitine CoA-transferase CaiB-like acyl-CoA transferase